VCPRPAEEQGTMSILLGDPWFLAMVEKVIARHRGAFTPLQIAAFRKHMAHTFETHPAARAVLLRARPDLAKRLAETEPN
jgi:hypothetical protein